MRLKFLLLQYLVLFQIVLQDVSCLAMTATSYIAVTGLVYKLESLNLLMVLGKTGEPYSIIVLHLLFQRARIPSIIIQPADRTIKSGIRFVKVIAGARHRH